MTETNETERGQWTSASSAQADALCAGRHEAQKNIPDEKSEDAAHGTGIHNALAMQDPKGLSTDQEETYDACNAIEQKLVAQLIPDWIAGMQPIRERRYWISWADGLKHSGQVDCVYRKGTLAVIFEYKTLPGSQVESSKNMQLRDQVCLFEQNNPLLTHVAAVVIQPLVTHSPEICVYSKEDIARAREEMYRRVAASNQKDAKRVAGELQCKFCKAKSKCEEYSAFAREAVAPFIPLTGAIATWTPEMRAFFMDRAPIAQKWLDDCKAEMKKLLKADPEAIPGYMLKDGNTRSTIVNAQSVFDRFSKSGGTLEQFMQCISVGKDDLKTALKEATKLKGKKLDEALDGVIAGNVETTQNEPSIVKKD